MVSALISDQIEALDDFHHSQENEESENASSDTIQHITVGSKEHPITFSDLEAQHANDSAFKDFRRKLNGFLNIFLPALLGSLPGNKWIQLKSHEKVLIRLLTQC